MVLVVLAVIWAAVLVPPMLRARAEARPADSISHFRRHLHVLQRAGPHAVRPANTLGVGGFGMASRAGHPAHGGGTLGGPAPQAFAAAPRAPGSWSSRYSPEAARRARTLKRRRDVFFTLLAAMAGTLVLGFLPAFRVLWSLHVVLDLVFGAYVALLVRASRMAAERDIKLRFLPATARADNVILLRRSAN